jgi:hypothetical protein
MSGLQRDDALPSVARALFRREGQQDLSARLAIRGEVAGSLAVLSTKGLAGQAGALPQTEQASIRVGV